MQHIEDLFPLWQRRDELNPEQLASFHRDLHEFITEAQGTSVTHCPEYRRLLDYYENHVKSSDTD